MLVGGVVGGVVGRPLLRSVSHTRVKDNAGVVDKGPDRQRPARRLEESQHRVEEPGEVFVTHFALSV